MEFFKILQAVFKEYALVSYFQFIMKKLSFFITLCPVTGRLLESIAVDHHYNNFSICTNFNCKS
jgi:hypothetical protein